MSHIKVKFFLMPQGMPADALKAIENKINDFSARSDVEVISIELKQSVTTIMVPADSAGGVVLDPAGRQGMIQATNVIYTGMVAYRKK